MKFKYDRSLDGTDHINCSPIGCTPLGRMLSNGYPFNFETNYISTLNYRLKNSDNKFGSIDAFKYAVFAEYMYTDVGVVNSYGKHFADKYKKGFDKAVKLGGFEARAIFMSLMIEIMNHTEYDRDEYFSGIVKTVSSDPLFKNEVKLALTSKVQYIGVSGLFIENSLPFVYYKSNGVPIQEWLFSDYLNKLSNLLRNQDKPKSKGWRSNV